MAIITFWSDYLKETGQTYTIASVATNIAINHNQRILLISTEYDDDSLESCFWNMKKQSQATNLFISDNKINIDSGIEGLVKAMLANRATPENIKNYTKVVFKDRLEVLPGFIGKNTEEYEKISKYYPDIIKTANKYYDFVMVDASKGLSPLTKDLLDISDLIVVNINQRLKTIDSYLELMGKKEISKKDNIIPVVGKYDHTSKYNAKNVTRYMKQRGEVLTISYNTLFFESCEEGKLADFLLKIRTLSGNNSSSVLAKEIENLSNAAIYKLKELQMRM